MIASGPFEQLVREASERAASLVVERMTETLRQLLAEREERWMPLHEILGISRRAAVARIRRSPELRSLGLAAGRSGQLLFRKSHVESLLTAGARK